MERDKAIKEVGRMIHNVSMDDFGLTECYKLAEDIINKLDAEQSRITEQGELFKKELEILRKLNERRSEAMHAYDIADWPVVDLCLAEIFTLEEQLANLHPITEQSSVVVTDDDIFI